MTLVWLDSQIMEHGADDLAVGPGENGPCFALSHAWQHGLLPILSSIGMSKGLDKVHGCTAGNNLDKHIAEVIEV